MIILSKQEFTEQDEYQKRIMLRYLKTNKLIKLTETIFDALEVEYESTKKLIEIMELIRLTYEDYIFIEETSTLQSLRELIRAEVDQDIC